MIQYVNAHKKLYIFHSLKSNDLDIKKSEVAFMMVLKCTLDKLEKGTVQIS